MTEPTYSMAQLALILSALENQRRNPNSKQTAMKAIERAAAALGVSTADVFAAADGLLDGRLSAEAWRAQLVEPSDAKPADEDVSVSAEIETVETTVEPAAAESAIGVRQQLLAACQAAEQWLLAERERPGETRPDAILAVLRAAIERAERRRRSRPVRPAGEPRRPRENSKEAQLIGMLRRPKGATIAQIMAPNGVDGTHGPRRARRGAEEAPRAECHLREAAGRRAGVSSGGLRQLQSNHRCAPGSRDPAVAVSSWLRLLSAVVRRRLPQRFGRRRRGWPACRSAFASA